MLNGLYLQSTSVVLVTTVSAFSVWILPFTHSPTFMCSIFSTRTSKLSEGICWFLCILPKDTMVCVRGRLGSNQLIVRERPADPHPSASTLRTPRWATACPTRPFPCCGFFWKCSRCILTFTRPDTFQTFYQGSGRKHSGATDSDNCGLT